MSEQNLPNLNNTPPSLKKVFSYANTIGLPFASFVGLAVFFIYIFFNIQFFPSGVSFGDSILFIMLAFAVGTIYLAYIYFAVFLGLPIYLRGINVIEKNNLSTNKVKDQPYTCMKRISRIFSQRWQWFSANLGKIMPSQEITFIYFVMWFIAIILGIITLIITRDFLKLGAFFLLILIGIGVCLSIHESWKAQASNSINSDELKNSKKNIFIVLLLAILFPFLLGIFGVETFYPKRIFSSFGIRTEQATIQIPKETFNQIYELHKIHQVTLDSNNVVSPENTETYYIKNVIVLWHRIGDTSYIQFGDEKKFFRMEVDQSNLKVSRGN